MSEAERESMIRGMTKAPAARLDERPDDLQGWLMLIRSYAVLQDSTVACGRPYHPCSSSGLNVRHKNAPVAPNYGVNRIGFDQRNGGLGPHLWY